MKVRRDAPGLRMVMLAHCSTPDPMPARLAIEIGDRRMHVGTDGQRSWPARVVGRTTNSPPREERQVGNRIVFWDGRLLRVFKLSTSLLEARCARLDPGKMWIVLPGVRLVWG